LYFSFDVLSFPFLLLGSKEKEQKKNHRLTKFAKNLQNHPKIHELDQLPLVSDSMNFYG
jgi:hypothetical protein